MRSPFSTKISKRSRISKAIRWRRSLRRFETGAPFPLQDRQFNGVVVTNYLQRDILSDICGAVAPGGLLIYETFGTGNESYSRPRSPDFLLKPGELLETVRAEFNILGYDHGLRCAPSTAVVQRIAAVKR